MHEIISKPMPDISGRKNEDATFFYEDERRIVAFLADGASSLADISSTSRNILDGHWASNTALDGVRKNIASLSAKHLLIKANDEVALAASELGVCVGGLPSESLPSSSGAVALIADKKSGMIDVAQVGDVISILVNRSGRARLAFNIKHCKEDAEAYQLALKISLASEVSIQEALKDKRVADLLVKGRSKENDQNGKGYGAINGSIFMKNYIMTNQFKIKDISKILILSDGFLIPGEKFESKINPQILTDLINSVGLEGCFQKIFDAKEADPTLMEYPRFKKHDDASAIILSF